MFEKIYKISKTLILAAFLLYGYNIIATPLNLIIPINILTVCLVALLGVPALFGMVLLMIIVF